MLGSNFSMGSTNGRNFVVQLLLNFWMQPNAIQRPEYSRRCRVVSLNVAQPLVWVKRQNLCIWKFFWEESGKIRRSSRRSAAFRRSARIYFKCAKRYFNTFPHRNHLLRRRFRPKIGIYRLSMDKIITVICL